MSKNIVHAVAVAIILTAGRLGAQDVKLGEEKPGLIAKAKVTFAAAKATAQAKVPNGKLVTAEVEQEDGKLIYTLVYKVAGTKGVEEVNVDALTGKVVAVEHESAEPGQPEKAEKKDAKSEKEDSAKAGKKAAKKGGGADH